MDGYAAALEQIDTWPVPTVGAAVVGPDGVLAARGQVAEPFYLASVTKPLTALAVLVAVEEGALDLDDPADEQLIPGATVRHLLAHASGLAPERRLRSFAPAYRRVYSNVGIELAADLVAAAVGTGFSDYFRAALAPLGLRATSLPGSPARDGRSSVNDLAMVAQLLLRPDTGRRPALLHYTTITDATRTVQYPGLRGVVPGYGGQDPNDWGLGFEIRGSKSPHWTGTSNSTATFGHFGQSGTFFWVDPVAELAMIALTDRDFGDWARPAWPALADAVLAVPTA